MALPRGAWHLRVCRSGAGPYRCAERTRHMGRGHVPGGVSEWDISGGA